VLDMSIVDLVVLHIHVRIPIDYVHRSNYYKITYFRRDIILHFCHIESLQKTKIHIFGRVVIENTFSYSWVLFLRSYHPRENK
jgi:hypothetical protein